MKHSCLNNLASCWTPNIGKASCVLSLCSSVSMCEDNTRQRKRTTLFKYGHLMVSTGFILRQICSTLAKMLLLRTLTSLTYLVSCIQKKVSMTKFYKKGMGSMQHTVQTVFVPPPEPVRNGTSSYRRQQQPTLLSPSR